MRWISSTAATTKTVSRWSDVPHGAASLSAPRQAGQGSAMISMSAHLAVATLGMVVAVVRMARNVVISAQ
ncbi:hypothetical protein MRF4_29075 [Methylobacterium radiotolerans]